MSRVATRTVGPSSRRDYGYCNARVRGMRSRLLSQSFMDGLMQSKDISTVIRTLMDTEYGPDLEEQIVHGRTARQVDLALRENMVRTFRKVLSLVNDEAAGLLTTILGRWDLFNIKTIIRGKHMSLDMQEVADSLIPVGQLTRIDFEELARQSDVAAVVGTLSTWNLPFGRALREAMPEYLADGNLAVLELALDTYYMGWAAKRLKGRGHNKAVVSRFLGVQVDTTNLLTAIRLLNADLGDEDPMRFFLPGGLQVTEALFRELTSMSDVDEVYDRLKRTPYGRPVEAVALKYVESGSIAVFERALEDYMFRRAYQAGRGDALGVGVLIGYLWAKANEVTNLRIVVKGVEIGIPQSRMREELIVV